MKLHIILGLYTLLLNYTKVANFDREYPYIRVYVYALALRAQDFLEQHGKLLLFVQDARTLTSSPDQRCICAWAARSPGE